MNAAFLLYGLLLLLEGSLAWALTGQSFLLMAVGVSLAVYRQMPQGSRPVLETVRLLTAAALAIAGPLQYQQSLAPLLLCFMAVPHFLAATQALAEQEPDPTPSPPRSRALVFTIAFYSSMGLVLLLARGLAPTLPRAVTASLALLVLLTALAAWQCSRIARLRPAVASPSPRPWLGPLLLLALVGLLYQGPLPSAAEFLCRVSPHAKGDSTALDSAPPPPRTPSNPAPSSPDEATRLGVDASALTGQHRLPARSNLQPTDAPRFLLKIEPDSPSPPLLDRGPLYLRSHTLNHFANNQWSPDVSSGHWLDDARDGARDGQVTLPPPHPSLPLLSYEIFALASDASSLPTLPGLASIQLPRVYALPGDTFQSTATGPIRYRARSAPALYQDLPNPSFLTAATPENPIHSRPASGELGLRLQPLAAAIFQKATLLDDRLAALHAYFAKNCTYSTVMRNPHDLPPLENFLFGERRGHCDFYASAAALLLRQVGLPTRVAYGFASRERDPATGLIVLRDRHAHAWTELFLQDYGWTLCDFTPPEQIAPPPPAPPNAPSPPLPDLQSFAPAAPAALPPPAAPTHPVPAPLASLLNWVQQPQPWLASFLRYAPLTLLLLALLLAARHWLRRPPTDPAAAARAARDQVPPYFREFLRLCAAAGHPKPEGRTPLEHHRALDLAGLPAALIHPLILYYCATRYEDAPPDPAREAALFLQLKSFAAALQPTTRQP